MPKIGTHTVQMPDELGQVSKQNVTLSYTRPRNSSDKGRFHAKLPKHVCEAAGLFSDGVSAESEPLLVRAIEDAVAQARLAVQDLRLVILIRTKDVSAMGYKRATVMAADDAVADISFAFKLGIGSYAQGLLDTVFECYRAPSFLNERADNPGIAIIGGYTRSRSFYDWQKWTVVEHTPERQATCQQIVHAIRGMHLKIASLFETPDTMARTLDAGVSPLALPAHPDPDDDEA